MLNSVSSCWKAAPVSEALSSWLSISNPCPSPMTRLFMSFSSRSRSSVKSSITFTSLEKVIMATMSAGVICVRRNFNAAVCARFWSWIGMDVMSKNITIRRRLRYLRFAGRLGRDLDGGDGLDGVFSGGFAAATSATGRGRGQRRAGRSSSNVLKFENADLLRLAIFGDGEIGGLQTQDGLAVLAFDQDILHHQLSRGGDTSDPFVGPVAASGGGCWRGKPPASTQEKSNGRAWHGLEPEPQRELHGAHGIGADRQSELGVS